jgi:D-alanyl-D-alanine carboxypeptidase (penicillin-binding protein 5/6)
MKSPPAVFIGFLLVGLLVCLVSFPGYATGQPAGDVGKAGTAYTGKTTKAKLKRAHKQKLLLRSALPQAVFLKDLATGEVLFERHSRRPMAPASLTKIMSAIVILEEGHLDDAVTISTRAAAAAPIKVHLKAGDVFPLRELLQAMLIRSANDACLAAAEHLAGTEEAFAVKMNAKAMELGLEQTHFRNACGFNTEGHYSTAEDLAALTEYAMRHETFASIVKEPFAVLHAVNRRKVVIAHTTNRLLGTLDGVVGVKTGYTRAAGRCLITVVRKDEKELLLVLLNTRQRWNTAQSLLEFGLRNPPVLPKLFISNG